MTKIILLAISSFFTITVSLCSNTNTRDSLIKSLKTLRHDTAISKTYINLSDYYQKEKPDSSLYYCNKAVKLMSKHKDDEPEIVLHYLNALIAVSWIHIIYFDEYNKGISHLKKALSLNSIIRKTSKNNRVIDETIQVKLTAYNYLGIAYESLNQNELALNFYQKALKICEDLNDIQGIIASNTNIAILHISDNNYLNAKKYCIAATSSAEKINNKELLSICYSNMSIIELGLENIEEAIAYSKKALKIFEESGNMIKIANGNQNLGSAIFESRTLTDDIKEKINICKKAEKYFKKSLNIAIDLNNKKSIYYALINLAKSKNELAVIDNTNKPKHAKEALQYSKKAYKIATELSAFNMIKSSSKNIYTAYELLDNITEAYKYSKIFINIQDTIYNKEKTEAIAKMESKYQAAKKQQEIERQQWLLEKNEIDLKKQKYLGYILIIGLISLSVVLILIYIGYRQKSKSNKILKKQKKEINKKNIELKEQKEEIICQNEEITSINDELHSKNKKIVKQKEKLDKMYSDITDSIEYAKRIQKALLPSSSVLEKNFTDYFILYEPKAIVSGDFYWIVEEGGNIFVAAVDCTGHGVPGAFMSMIGNTLLNEIVKSKNNYDPGSILNELNIGVIAALNQNSEEHGANDGMDMMLCKFNFVENELQYAGANHYGYVLNNNDITRITGMPFSIGEKRAIKKGLRYKTHSLGIQKGMSIYLFSDGYQDQFGGNENKKYGTVNFKNTLIENGYKSMSRQKEVLLSSFKKWKGNYKQIDDVLIIGIKI